MTSLAKLFFTGQLQNPWQMLAEPWGSTEPWLKIAASIQQNKTLFEFFVCHAISRN